MVAVRRLAFGVAKGAAGWALDRAVSATEATLRNQPPPQVCSIWEVTRLQQCQRDCCVSCKVANGPRLPFMLMECLLWRGAMMQTVAASQAGLSASQGPVLRIRALCLRQQLANSGTCLSGRRRESLQIASAPRSPAPTLS